jgi:hypothetical protein
MSPLVAIFRPFCYVLDVQGGQHKSIVGKICFFNQDVVKNSGAIQSQIEASRNTNVYVVLSGRFSMEQRNIIKLWTMLNLSNFKTVYNWLSENQTNYKICQILHIVQNKVYSKMN